MKRVEILGQPVDIVSLNQAVTIISAAIEEGRRLHVVTPNPEMVVMARKNRRFAKILSAAGLHIPDGVGLQMAADFLDSSITPRFFFREVGILYQGLVSILRSRRGFKVIPERVSGVDLFNRVIEVAADEGWKIFLLGGAEGVAEQAQERIMQISSAVRIVGVYSGGVVDREGNSSSDRDTIDAINRSQAVILLVSFGAPKQDLWIASNLSRLYEIRVAIGAGGTLDFMAGRQVRAPQGLRRLGLEWLWRVLLDPRRIGRVINAGVIFPILVVREKYSMVKSSYEGQERAKHPRKV